jgi:hypothetical protein
MELTSFQILKKMYVYPMELKMCFLFAQMIKRAKILAPKISYKILCRLTEKLISLLCSLQFFFFFFGDIGV